MNQNNILTEGILGALFKRQSIRDRLNLKELESTTIHTVEDIKKLVPRAREDFRIIVADLVKITDLMRKQDPEWDGSFLTLSDKKSGAKKQKKEPEEETADKTESAFHCLTDDRYLEAAPDNGQLKSILVRMSMPKNVWYSYFFSETKFVSRIMSNMKKGNIRENIDEIFPINMRDDLNYHSILFADVPTIRKRGNAILDNTDKLITLYEELDEANNEQTRRIVFAWAFRAYESWPRYERVCLSLISRYE